MPRPILHPSMEDVTVAGILYALSDPTRAYIYMDIAKADCPQICSTYLQCHNKPIPKSTLSQHFKVLREAGLIRSEKRGVEIHNRSRCEELKENFGNLIVSILEAYNNELKKNCDSKD